MSEKQLLSRHLENESFALKSSLIIFDCKRRVLSPTPKIVVPVFGNTLYFFSSNLLMSH